MPSAAAEDAYRRAREHLATDDLDGATQWLERAAEHAHPAALTELAIVHLHGFGRDADPQRALQLLLRAERAGGTAETPWLLAQIVLGGVLLPCEPTRVDTLLADSARRGHPAALRVAGLCFGCSTDPDLQRAATICLKRACELRDPVGTALFADRLHAGVGIVADPATALGLARELRAMGIPVELPSSSAYVACAEPPSTHTEPPWERLRLLEPVQVPRIVHCQSPQIATFDGLLGDEQCRYVIYTGAPFLERSQVVDPATGRQLANDLRTSQGMSFTPTLEDLGIRLLQHRLSGLCGFELAQCEPLTLLHYGVGEQYRPHRDYFMPSAPQLRQPGGQRHSTVCVYLNEVVRGGQTDFPERGVSVNPQRGRAVTFANLTADGKPDPASLHAGVPVLAGEKWLSTCWIREHRARSF
ncbi:MAG: 2OG-Fe(II) oxygenase [Proteobacteria bacterium]|nr:2OG-Fe(II) oxygenase [Pseudomonadota bacterium]MBS0463715.1 2OG-Fe(II) oxygenase [Pseudomonadota bacterium]